MSNNDVKKRDRPQRTLYFGNLWAIRMDEGRFNTLEPNLLNKISLVQMHSLVPLMEKAFYFPRVFQKYLIREKKGHRVNCIVILLIFFCFKKFITRIHACGFKSQMMVKGLCIKKQQSSVPSLNAILQRQLTACNSFLWYDFLSYEFQNFQSHTLSSHLLYPFTTAISKVLVNFMFMLFIIFSR